MKLTNRQVEALAALDSWRKGMEIGTANLRADGVSLAVLRSLEANDLVAGARYSNGIFWHITDAGRAALKDTTHAE